MFDRRSITLTVPNPAATIAGTLNLRSDYARVVGFKALLTGTDTAVRVRITDADSRIVYLDAADKDYKTAAIHRLIGWDNTTTGLTTVPTDATGAAATAEYSVFSPIVRNPLEIAVVNGGTAGDVIVVDLDYESLDIGKVSSTLTVPNPAATVAATINLPGVKYGQVLGFRALASADATTQIELKDADSRIFYKDAADRDYTSQVDRLIQWDDTLTGLSFSNADATGAVFDGIAHMVGFCAPVVKSPITVTYSNNGTASATLALSLYYRK